jgi:hypothetical protein
LIEGEVSEQNCYWNIEAAYNFLVEVRNIPPESIVLYGRSVGSGPTCYLAAKTAMEGRSVGGVILHSPFLSICRVAVDAGFSFPGDLFRNIEQAPKIRCPVLIVHGTADAVVPFWHGQELLMHVPKEYRAPPFWAEGMGHNGIEFYMKQEYYDRVSSFLEKYIASSAGIPCPPQPIPEFDRADFELAERSPCTVRMNMKWFNHGARILRIALKRQQRVASPARKKVAQDQAQQFKQEGTASDDEASRYNEYDNKTLFTAASEKRTESDSHSKRNNIGS